MIYELVAVSKGNISHELIKSYLSYCYKQLKFKV